MLAVAVNGSPKKNGNTYDLLNLVLQPLGEAGWESKILQAGGSGIKPCRACFKCHKLKNNSCSLEADSFNEIMPELIRADAVILGSPTYFSSLTPEMKSLIDRAGIVSGANGGLFRGKIGAAVAAVRRAGSIAVVDVINHFFLISSMIVPGSTYWNMGFGLVPGDARKDEEGAANMAHLGKMIAWLGAALKDKRAGIPQ
ncbi:MAG: flavodoxin family protein [Desulfarculales bacterium]|jgi:multimeric flavodoxin WrbA|nr:flavodoxin family protein [Desulfarculales bacterium]